MTDLTRAAVHSLVKHGVRRGVSLGLTQGIAVSCGNLSPNVIDAIVLQTVLELDNDESFADFIDSVTDRILTDRGWPAAGSQS